MRSHLEYGAVIQYPNYLSHINRILFVDFIGVKGLSLHTIKCDIMSLELLSRRRDNVCIFFMHDMLTNHHDAPQLLSLIYFGVPPRVLCSIYFGGAVFGPTIGILSQPIMCVACLISQLENLGSNAECFLQYCLIFGRNTLLTTLTDNKREHLKDYGNQKPNGIKDDSLRKTDSQPSTRLTLNTSLITGNFRNSF